MTSSTVDDQNVTIRVKTRTGPRAIIPVWILDYDPTGAQLRFMIAMWSYADGSTGEAWPTMAKIAKRARISLSTARSALQWARRCWLIETEARHRADGSFGGWTCTVADVDPRSYGGPGPEAKPTKTAKHPELDNEAGTPVGAPATNRHESDTSQPGGSPDLSENVQNSSDIDRVRRSAYLPTPIGAPIELPKGTTQKTSSSIEPVEPTSIEVEQDKEEDATQKPQNQDNQPVDPAVVAARSMLSKVTTGLPTAQTLTGWQRGRLVGSVAGLIRCGWSSSTLVARLGTGLGSAVSIYAVLTSRLSDLVAEDAPTQPPAPDRRSEDEPGRSTAQAGTGAVADWRVERPSTVMDDATRAAAQNAIAAGLALVSARSARIVEGRKTRPSSAAC